MFCNGSQYLQLVLKNTLRRQTTLKLMKNLCKLKTPLFLRGIALLSKSIVPKKLSSSGKYITGKLIWYTMQMITEAEFALPHTAVI